MIRYFSTITFVGCCLLLLMFSLIATGNDKSSGQYSLIEGQISFLETDGTLIVKAKNITQIIYANEKTTITKKGEQIKFQDLKTGDRIHATYDDMRIAIEIIIKSE